MPAIYAHDRFGRQVLEELSDELAGLIKKYEKQYRIGLQGPDIFFFLRPWNGPVNAYGNHLHDISAYPFLEHALKVVQKKGTDSPEYAYILGFVGHFILDSECHGYVEEMVDALGVGHLEIEEEFEKMLLKEDGEDPVAYPVAELIPRDEKTAKAIAPFYGKGITKEIVKKSLEDMFFVKHVFTAPGLIKQGLINGIMKLTALEAKWKGLMNQRKDNLLCVSSNEGLYERYQAAIPVAVTMMQQFHESVLMEHPLHSRFDRNFL